MKRVRLLLVMGLAPLLCAAAPPLAFVPARPGFALAAEEYRRLWEADGQRMVAALEGVTGLAFPDAPMEVLVSEGPSMTAFDGGWMRLRAGYSADEKRAVLVHELGHRLAFAVERPAELDDHRLLFLFLYDVWIDLHGREFADRMVRIERQALGGYDYDAAWRWALAMTRAQRQERLAALRARPAAEREAAWRR